MDDSSSAPKYVMSFHNIEDKEKVSQEARDPMERMRNYNGFGFLEGSAGMIVEQFLQNSKRK